MWVWMGVHAGTGSQVWFPKTDSTVEDEQTDEWMNVKSWKTQVPLVILLGIPLVRTAAKLLLFPGNIKMQMAWMFHYKCSPESLRKRKEEDSGSLCIERHKSKQWGKAFGSYLSVWKEKKKKRPPRVSTLQDSWAKLNSKQQHQRFHHCRS